MAGLLDFFNQGGGLLGEEEKRRAQQAGLMGLATGLLGAGQPSRMPIGFGAALGQGLGGFAQAQGDAMDSALKEKAMGQQFAMNDTALQKAKYDLRRERDWYGNPTQMVGAPQPNGEMVGPAGPAGATPAAMGVPGGATSMISRLPPDMQQYVRQLGPVEGPKFLAGLAAKQMETGQWSDEDQAGVKGQRNKFTGEFKPYPANVLPDQWEPIPGTNLQINKRTGERKPADNTPKTNVSVSVKGPVAGAESAWKGVAEQWTTMRDNVARANKREANFQNYETAMQSFDPGIDANVRMRAAQAFNAIGLKTNAPQAELMLKIQRENELANTPRGQGQITENERVLIRDANNIFGSTPQGARLIIAATRQADNYDRQVFEIMTNSAKNNGGSPNPVEVSQAIANLGPVLDPNLEAQLRATAGQGGGQTGQWSIKKK